MWTINDFKFWSKNDDFSALLAQIRIWFVRRFGCFARIFCSRPTIFTLWFWKNVYFAQKKTKFLNVFLKSSFKYSRPGAKNPGKTSKSSYKSQKDLSKPRRKIIIFRSKCEIIKQIYMDLSKNPGKTAKFAKSKKWPANPCDLPVLPVLPVDHFSNSEMDWQNGLANHQNLEVFNFKYF